LLEGQTSAPTQGVRLIATPIMVAPLFEHTYARRRSGIWTWLPFVAVFAAAWAAGGEAYFARTMECSRL
jgi:hypothetical protein